MKQGIVSTFVLLVLLVLATAAPFCSAGFWGSGSGPTDDQQEQQQQQSNQESVSAAEAAPSAKLDYKLTLKRPYFYNGTIPFWKMSQGVIKADDFVRLAPSIPGARGWVWSERPNTHDEWQAEVTFRVTGSHMHGGRGLAFWYTKEAMGDGPIFGAGDKWDGLGIWLDSANPRTHTPTTMALLNDGSLAFSSRTDPSGYIIGSCQINYRNTGNVPARLRVTYTAKTLTVMLDPMGDGKDYRTCIQKTGIALPSNYYFGFSAASHNPADDHDIISFETWQLNPPAKMHRSKRPMEEEMINQGEEFKELNEEQKRASIFDTQRRVLEDIQIMQMQIEAIGAPSPEDLLLGNYEKKTTASGSSSSSDGDSKETM
ncbi:concanavalin A-like lectin/glucanase domain-containing protein [Zychaea mexicana]|uniref:concanavalin A-like lectin/glucanase domain-containing protein n=1 Tax=Zychaea mexicana TaxID=64656 RepID=UPI0022FE8064|nr:concanavalin A-like lectin/glucanase domain-containing protein [Zychaea mexicana]KAI9489143.1 concanavalin A-like lectin/glucanase domain-containing protein [Zychaea mexicana]